MNALNSLIIETLKYARQQRHASEAVLEHLLVMNLGAYSPAFYNACLERVTSGLSAKATLQQVHAELDPTMPEAEFNALWQGEF